MRIVIFCHSLISDWNHGNAHFLRGITSELIGRGHDVRVFEPAAGWSARNLRSQYGDEPFERFRSAYPHLRSETYTLSTLDLDAALDGADLVIVHEWSDPELVARVGSHRRSGDYVLLFHDTHHRSVTAPEEMSNYDLREYDGVLAFGESVAAVYRKNRWAKHVWVWHEAADTNVFYPIDAEKQGDLVWIGNWGDDERSAELREYLIEPAGRLGLRARVHGVRYPPEAIEALAAAGIEYKGWTPNFTAPEIFARYRMTVHVPRRPYATALPGVPTIRIFEALACGIPLVSAPWDDSEELFTPGDDFLVARDGTEMQGHLQMLLKEPEEARALAERGRRTVLSRHTCKHRVDELLEIYGSLRSDVAISVGGKVH